MYLPHPSSSFSEENYSSPSATHPDMGYSLPMPMKTPGMAIPTPQTKSLAEHQARNAASMSMMFPLQPVHESPQMELTRHVNLSQSVSESQDGHEEDHDDDYDDAFLPNDFKQTNQTYTWEQVQRFVQDAEAELKQYMEEKHQDAMEDYQEHMERQLQVHGSQWKDDAEAEYERLNQMLKIEKSKTQQKHLELLHKVSSMADVEANLHSTTEEKRNLEARVKALEAQLEEEAQIDNDVNEILVQKLQAQIRDLQSQLKNAPSIETLEQLQREKQETEDQVQELEKLVLQSQNQMKTMELNNSMSIDSSSAETLKALHEQEVATLQAEKDAALELYESLQKEMEAMLDGKTRETERGEELMKLQSELAASHHKIEELNDQLVIQKRLKEDLSATQSKRLEEARKQIDTLQQQLRESTEAVNQSFSSVASQEELFAAKAQVETLRVLRDEDLKEKSELKDQLNKAMTTPRKKGRESKLEIDTLTIEVLPSPNVSMVKDDDESVVQMRSELESLRAERDSLEKQLRELEVGHNTAADQVREELEAQIEALKEELDSRDEAFAVEKRSLQADLSVQEIEEFTSEVQMLKETHRKELEKTHAELTASKEEALAEITKKMIKMRGEFEEEIKLLDEGHTTERMALQKELETMKEQFAEEYAHVQAKTKSDSKTEIDTLQAKLEKLRIEFEDEKIEIIRTSSIQLDELQTKLSAQQQEHEGELENLEGKMKNLEDQIEKLHQEAKERENCAITEDHVKEIREAHDKELQESRISMEVSVAEDKAIRSKLEADISSLQEKIATLEAGHQEEIRVATKLARKELETELKTLEASVKSMEAGGSTVSELKAQREQDREEFNRRIREVREEHNKEIDDLLKQLDLVEAEHIEKASVREKLVGEKETVILALGVQLSEAEKKLQATIETKDKLSREMGEVRVELDQARSEIDAKTQDVRKLEEAHAEAQKEEGIIREKLCEEAREEMIQRAEVQFEQANLTYKKLKHEFDTAMAKIGGLEKELKIAKKNAIDIKREKEGREASLKDELVQAKAAGATKDLNASRKMKQYRSDLEAATLNEADLQRQLDEAVTTSQSIQKTLATIIEEKTKLMEENKDLKAVCEELMEIVESGK